MSRESIVFLFGIIVFITPFFGVADDMKRYIIIVSGIILIIAGYQLRRAAYFRSIEEQDGDHKSESFVESRMSETEPVPEEEASANTAGRLEVEKVL